MCTEGHGRGSIQETLGPESTDAVTGFMGPGQGDSDETFPELPPPSLWVKHVVRGMGNGA